MTINVRFKRVKENDRQLVKLPKYSNDSSLGFDLISWEQFPVVISGTKSIKVRTGLCLGIPSNNFLGVLFSDRKLAELKGLTLSTRTQLISPGFNEEIIISLCPQVNFNGHTINPGDPIARLVFMPVQRARILDVKCLTSGEPQDK